jgi:hypothetical protein
VRIDLHCHTNASDVTDTPAELVRAAMLAELDVVAITDHDTTAGWDEALASRGRELTVVTGAEFSCFHLDAEGRRISLHVLGYLFDPDEAGLRTERERLQESRRTRGHQIVENLVVDGYPITWAQVSAFADGGSVGRPHIGRALVESGVVPDVTSAFRELLSGRGKYYVAKRDTPVLDAISLIRGAGGLPVFAHPFARRRGPVVADVVVATMAEAGLVGLEVVHPDQDAADQAHAAGLARELGLIPTGSSDYHGANKRVPIGAGLTTDESYERLLALPAARRPVSG